MPGFLVESAGEKLQLCNNYHVLPEVSKQRVKWTWNSATFYSPMSCLLFGNWEIPHMGTAGERREMEHIFEKRN